MILILGTMMILLSSCGKNNDAEQKAQEDITDRNRKEEVNERMNLRGNYENKKVIYLAGGCFWGVEAYFEKVHGIIDVESGYANGDGEDTNYEKINRTGHAETVKVIYDANSIHLAEILDRYYSIIDPTSLNRQGNDEGIQYRVGVYYEDEADRPLIELSLGLLDERLEGRSVIELEPLKNYIAAEEYHQDYLMKNPSGYCHIDLNLRDRVLYPGEEKPTDETLKKALSPLSYRVTQQADTEAPFTSEYDSLKDAGIYVDIVTGQPLFSSDDKYDSGCGWPSFTQSITTDVMLYSEDRSHNMIRTEVETADSKNHLGHVFNDGPKEEGGLRYCINGAALKFIPREQMKAQGYAALLPYVMK